VKNNNYSNNNDRLFFFKLFIYKTHKPHKKKRRENPTGLVTPLATKCFLRALFCRCNNNSTKYKNSTNNKKKTAARRRIPQTKKRNINSFLPEVIFCHFDQNTGNKTQKKLRTGHKALSFTPSSPVSFALWPSSHNFHTFAQFSSTFFRSLCITVSL